jgi:hypothetical protein
MPDADEPLTANEIKMARDLCDLVTSWSFGCTLDQAHAIMDEVWTDRAARSWYEKAAELRDRQMASMVRAVEDDDQ